MTKNTKLSSYFKEEYKKLMEGLESSAEMIDTNIVDLEDMRANVKPGEFAPNEITNKENLENTAKMANDNAAEDETVSSDNASVSISISASSDNEEHDPECDCPECEKRPMIDISADNDKSGIENIFGKIFGESVFAKIVKESIEEVIGTDYPGPLDFNPDTRIGTADVLNTLKKEIGKGSEGIHVDRENAQNGKYEYKVSQIDEKLLPKKIQVGTQELTLKDGSYVPSDIVKAQAK